MAVTVVGNSTAGGTTTVNKPANTASGELLVLFMASHAASTAPTLPTGWTSITTNANAGGWSTAAAYKVAGTSEPASYTWTQGNGSNWNTALIVRCQGQDSTTQVDGSSKGSGTSGTLALTAITASVAGDALLVYSADWTDIGVATWPLSGTTYVNDLTADDQEIGSATGLASGSTGAMSVVYNSGTGGNLNVIAVLVKAAASSTHSLATETRSHFLSRAVLVTSDRAHFLTRAQLQEQSRSRFQTRAVLHAQSRAHFLSRAVQSTVSRAKFLTRTNLLTGTRSRFQTRISALATASRSHFLISTLHQLGTVLRSHFVARAGMRTNTRARFAVRVPLATRARSLFQTRFQLMAAGRGRFVTRIANLVSAQRARFMTRATLSAATRSRFLVNATVITYPFQATAMTVKQVLSAAFAVLRALTATFAYIPELSPVFAVLAALHASFASSSAFSVSFVRSPLVANPNSTIQVTATLTDINGNPVSNASAVSCTVTFPDGSTQSFSLTSGITNAGSGKYTLTYKTKTPGVNLEDWTFTAADGVTTAEYHNNTPVEF